MIASISTLVAVATWSAAYPGLVVPVVLLYIWNRMNVRFLRRIHTENPDDYHGGVIGLGAAGQSAALHDLMSSGLLFLLAMAGIGAALLV